MADSRRLGSRTDTVDSWNGRRGSSRTPRAAAVSAGTALWRTLSRTLRAPVGRADTVRAATALLGGQWAGHYALTGTLDHHGGVLDVPHLPNGPMVVAHLLAAIACAALILAAERLYLVASGVIRSVLTAPAPATRRPATRWPTTFGQALGTRRDPARSPRAPPLFV
ncbi:hypothetical protein FNL39_1011030 [Nocardia caishijiensis]|uniref:Uncharacterized protein n=1 Tax=Nocardia caishijiensis TaxID=184756 RepID=A0ABQ6YVD9_9NOCA|nr:hypothetical protein FNL39_1011030 [Nocardia caishijiensis]